MTILDIEPHRVPTEGEVLWAAVCAAANLLDILDTDVDLAADSWARLAARQAIDEARHAHAVGELTRARRCRPFDWAIDSPDLG